MRAFRSAVATLLLTLPAAAQTLIYPGEAIATIDAEHLRAYVPAAAAERLREVVARADQIYAHMQRDAGFEPGDKLRLLLADFEDAHNGYSFVVPFPLVQVVLAPSEPDSTIFAGGGDFERMLVHEFAHQLSNDRNHGIRAGLESVFGRVLPNDLLSFLLWYLSTPAHQTMPRFWHEGTAVWAETSYADPASVWAGRGRDPLTHMVWRLDAAHGGIPDESAWRITWHEWPFGGEAYLYGTAYARFLEGHLGDRASVWKLIQAQARSWPFLFDRGPRRVVGSRHGDLLSAARAALQEEQERVLAVLRAAPVTEARRLTPEDMLVAAPAWREDGALVFAAKPAQGRARLHTLSADGELDGSWTTTLALSPVRALPDIGLAYHDYNWRAISRVTIDGDTFGWRMMQPDAAPLRNGARSVVAIQLRDGGGQDLVVHTLRDGELDAGRVLATEGTPWTPALRPNSDDQLVWVETDPSGSRLVLGSFTTANARTVLWHVRGRILHPVWARDGDTLYACSDVTGVANAYRITVTGTSATVQTITNTLGGVIACVPSPDGNELAIVDHDARGPFLATISADPATFAPVAPPIPLPWPAPVAPTSGDRNPAAMRPTPLPPPVPGAGDALTIEPYSSLGELRPLFWAPSTFAVPDGGYGVFGLMADPLLTTVVQGGVGTGFAEQEPVAFASFDHLGTPIQFGASGGRSERTFFDTVLRAGEELDYTETVAHGEVRLGRGLFALERTLIAYVSAGVEDHSEVDDTARENVGGVPLKAPFRDTEHYAELTFGYDDSTYYPTSFAREDGLRVLGRFRHSGLGGELERDVAFGDASYTWSLFPEAGHQVVVRGQIGWSDGDDTLQGNFTIGGGLSTGLPRGYLDGAVATGRHLLAGSLAYRLPVFRPFVAASTTPFRGRQLVVEVFGDTAQVSLDHLGGDGEWFTSVGAELLANAEFFDAVLSPGIGVAVQLDGERDVRAYFTIGFGF